MSRPNLTNLQCHVNVHFNVVSSIGQTCVAKCDGEQPSSQETQQVSRLADFGLQFPDQCFGVTPQDNYVRKLLRFAKDVSTEEDADTCYFQQTIDKWLAHTEKTLATTPINYNQDWSRTLKYFTNDYLGKDASTKDLTNNQQITYAVLSAQLIHMFGTKVFPQIPIKTKAIDDKQKIINFGFNYQFQTHIAKKCIENVYFWTLPNSHIQEYLLVSLIFAPGKGMTQSSETKKIAIQFIRLILFHHLDQEKIVIRPDIEKSLTTNIKVGTNRSEYVQLPRFKEGEIWVDKRLLNLPQQQSYTRTNMANLMAQLDDEEEKKPVQSMRRDYTRGEPTEQKTEKLPILVSYLVRVTNTQWTPPENQMDNYTGKIAASFTADQMRYPMQTFCDSNALIQEIPIEGNITAQEPPPYMFKTRKPRTGFNTKQWGLWTLNNSSGFPLDIFYQAAMNNAGQFSMPHPEFALYTWGMTQASNGPKLSQLCRMVENCKKVNWQLLDTSFLSNFQRVGLMHMLANMFLKMWFNFEEETSYGNSIIFVGEPAGGKTFLTSVARQLFKATEIKVKLQTSKPVIDTDSFNDRATAFSCFGVVDDLTIEMTKFRNEYKTFWQQLTTPQQVTINIKHKEILKSNFTRMVIIATNTRLDDMDRREDVNSEVFDIVERRIQFVNIFPMKKFTNKSSQRNTIKQEVTIAKIWALMEVMNCIYQKGIPPSKWSPDELVNVDLDSNVLSKTALKHIQQEIIGSDFFTDLVKYMQRIPECENMWFKPAVMFTEDYNLICHAIGGNKDINEDLEGARKKAFQMLDCLGNETARLDRELLGGTLPFEMWQKQTNEILSEAMALERPEPSVLTKRKAQDVIMLTELRECVNTSGVQGEKKGDEDENEKLKQLLEIDEDY